jgi:alpha-galactosidase
MRARLEPAGHGKTLRDTLVRMGPPEVAPFLLRRYVRDALAPDVMGRRPHPIAAYDHWFGIEQRISEPLLRRQADRAAELGLEYFVVDAAWFGGATANFAYGVGNWERVDETKFPGGLEPLAEYVRSKGMHFGLWFEPERGRRGSDWVVQHPTWYWDTGHPLNLQLDLTRREVQDAVIEMLSA